MINSPDKQVVETKLNVYVLMLLSMQQDNSNLWKKLQLFYVLAYVLYFLFCSLQIINFLVYNCFFVDIAYLSMQNFNEKYAFFSEVDNMPLNNL